MSSTELVTKYDILGCQPNACITDIRKSYQKLILSQHPDKRMQLEKQQKNCETYSGTINNNNNNNNGRTTIDDTEQLNRITNAWNTLRDPEKRKQYDAELLQKRFNEKPIIFDIVTRKQFHFDNELNAAICKCRCGGYYTIPDDDFNCDVDDDRISSSIIDNDNDSENNYFIECNQCSLVIQYDDAIR